MKIGFGLNLPRLPITIFRTFEQTQQIAISISEQKERKWIERVGEQIEVSEQKRNSFNKNKVYVMTKNRINWPKHSQGEWQQKQKKTEQNQIKFQKKEKNLFLFQGHFEENGLGGANFKSQVDMLILFLLL